MSLSAAHSGKVALITGVTGQDGAYLADLLLAKGYSVHAIKRRSSSFNTGRIEHLYQDPHEPVQRFMLHYGDMTDSTNLIRIVQEIQPDEIYNLAAQSHVQVVVRDAEYTANADAHRHAAPAGGDPHPRARRKDALLSGLDLGALRQGRRRRRKARRRRSIRASPYAAAKLYAYWITVNYREAYGIHASNGILFNHESPLRGETFVTRKITRAVAAIKLGLQDKLYLGNLDAKRDWGHAREYVAGMWLMLQQDEPDDYVLATGETTHGARASSRWPSPRSAIAFEWRGEGVEEKGFDAQTGKVLVEVDPRYFRPTEVDLLIGDRHKGARSSLGWRHENECARARRRNGPGDLKIMQSAAIIERGARWRRSSARRQAGLGRRPSRHGRRRPSVRRLAREDCEILTVDRAEGRSEATSGGRGLDRPATRPDAVFLAAAKVGGILANDTYPADFLYDNLMIEANVIEAAFRAGVEKLLFLGSSLHLSEVRAAADRRGRPADRPARADQRMVRHRQDRRHQAGAGLSPAARLRLHLGHADQSLRPRRQFRPADQPRPAGADPQGARGQAARRRRADHLGHGHAAARIPACRRLRRRLVLLMNVYSGDGHVNVGSARI